MSKYLWLVTQEEITAWSTYRSAVVVAKTEDEARCILPTSKLLMSGAITWCTPEFPEYVTVRYLGVAKPGLEGVICVNTIDKKENEQ